MSRSPHIASERQRLFISASESTLTFDDTLLSIITMVTSH